MSAPTVRAFSRSNGILQVYHSKLETTHESSRNPILIMLCFNIWIDWMSHQNQILDGDNANISIILYDYLFEHSVLE